MPRLHAFLLPSFPLCPRNFLSTRSEASTFLTPIFHSRFSLLRPSLFVITRRGKGLDACVIIYEHIVYAFALKEFVTPSALGFCYVCFSTTHVWTCLLAMHSKDHVAFYGWTTDFRGSWLKVFHHGDVFLQLRDLVSTLKFGYLIVSI